MWRAFVKNICTLDSMLDKLVVEQRQNLVSLCAPAPPHPLLSLEDMGHYYYYYLHHLIPFSVPNSSWLPFSPLWAVLASCMLWLSTLTKRWAESHEVLSARTLNSEHKDTVMGRHSAWRYSWSGSAFRIPENSCHPSISSPVVSLPASFW